MPQPFDPRKLASLLRQLRKRHRLSLNQLAKATGISRRTLARIENVRRIENVPGSLSLVPREQRSSPRVPGTTNKVPPAGLSPRTAYKLAKALLGEEETSRRLEEHTRLSRFLGSDPLYKFLDDLYYYPSFLFHDSPAQRALRAEFGDDYRHSLDLLLRSRFGTRNLAARLRAFRMRHDLTLVETAALVGLSKSELHRLERAERSPSPRTRYRILRLLTVPLEGGEFTRANSPVARRASLEESRGNPRRVSPPSSRPTLSFDSAQDRPVRRHGSEPAAHTPLAKTLAGSAGRKPRPTGRVAWLEAARAALAEQPPRAAAGGDALDNLRHLWLAGPLKTRELAAALGVSPPHLIRLVRGDCRPRRALLEAIERLVASL